MDDLTQQLQKVLSDPQTMGQLQGLLSSLGGQEEKPAPAPSGGPDLSALLGAWGGGQASPPPAESPSTALAGINPQALSLRARLGPLLSQANREDDATRLLRALRPLLGEARQKKVDEAIQILQMLRLQAFDMKKSLKILSVLILTEFESFLQLLEKRRCIIILRINVIGIVYSFDFNLNHSTFSPFRIRSAFISR
mgnify:CR=1 FL=1